MTEQKQGLAEARVPAATRRTTGEGKKKTKRGQPHSQKTFRTFHYDQ